MPAFRSMEGRFFCVKDDCGFIESFKKSRALLRSMEQCFLFFMEIEKNPTPGRSPNIALLTPR